MKGRGGSSCVVLCCVCAVVVVLYCVVLCSAMLYFGGGGSAKTGDPRAKDKDSTQGNPVFVDDETENLAWFGAQAWRCLGPR